VIFQLSRISELHVISRSSVLRYKAVTIPGDNIRVHTVGDRWFATRIRSPAVDYRYAHEEGLFINMEPATLPNAVASACLRVVRQFGLLFAGIDLKETPEGNYYCFEVNPSPGFIVYEQCGGQAISQALAEFLHRGQTGGIPVEEASAAF
jgi:glutathione synthase/RimK-type ligase-like ATP-grasp enzyme